MKIRLLIITVIFSYIASAQTRLGSSSNPDTLGVANSIWPTAYYGTLAANTTYIVVGNIAVQFGDTLIIPSGVTLCMENDACIDVLGSLISLGTQAAPNWFTVCGRPKTDNFGQPLTTDSAWSGGTETGLWPGIECDTSCKLLVLKWTHVEFAGAGANSIQLVNGVAVGATKTNYGILFQNLNGNFIMEDSWMYATLDDAIRVQGGHFDIMRNTFEKTGYQNGDCNNMKSGAVGDCAYNLYIGCCTNGTKASNKGSAIVQDNFNMYNNTYVNCGYRQTQSGRGANINYEQEARGSAYNNLIVDCKFGLRIVGNPVADTNNCYYGNNYIYGDSTSLTTQFYPVGFITKPDAYSVPNPSVTGYVYNPSSGAAQPTGTELTDDIALDGANNPLFVNFPLPENAINYPGMQTFADINNFNCIHAFSFHLQSSSPAIGKGNTNASYMLNACSAITNPNWGPNESVPCADMGCYPTIYNNGNHHDCTGTVGIEQISTNTKVSIFPNPNHGSFTLSLSNISEKCNLEIYNVLEEKVYDGMLNPPAGGQHDNLIKLTGQPNGLYLYRVLKEDGSFVGSGKIVVE